MVSRKNKYFFFLGLQNNMSLEVILGCMFSGKSSTLLKKISSLRAIGKKCILINHSLDTRCEDEVKTHENVKSKAKKFKNLKDFKEWNNYEVIGIDESQFFDDIAETVQQYLKHGKIVIAAGLNGDFNRKPFPNISNLIALATDIIFTKALCTHCLDGSKATFSRRTHGSKESILVGGEKMYEPVCLVHFYAKKID